MRWILISTGGTIILTGTAIILVLRYLNNSGKMLVSKQGKVLIHEQIKLGHNYTIFLGFKVKSSSNISSAFGINIILIDKQNVFVVSFDIIIGPEH